MSDERIELSDEETKQCISVITGRKTAIVLDSQIPLLVSKVEGPSFPLLLLLVLITAVALYTIFPYINQEDEVYLTNHAKRELDHQSLPYCFETMLLKSVPTGYLERRDYLVQVQKKYGLSLVNLERPLRYSMDFYNYNRKTRHFIKVTGECDGGFSDDCLSRDYQSDYVGTIYFTPSESDSLVCYLEISTYDNSSAQIKFDTLYTKKFSD